MIGMGVSIFPLLVISIGVLNMALPMNSINILLFHVKQSSPLKETYQENMPKF
jgi:hypothetical protein